MTMAAQRAREDGKSSHHARDVNIKEDNADDPRAVAIETWAVVVSNVPNSF